MNIVLQWENPLHGDFQHVEEHWSTIRIRQEVSRENGVQEANQNEHANGQGGKGKDHTEAVETQVYTFLIM